MSNDREVLTSSVSVEWFTPSIFIEAARNVLGKIDLDPASCQTANETVKAVRFFNKEANGLKRDWKGNVFVNPPYGRTGQTDWTKKMVEEYTRGNVKEAIILVNSATGNKWFQKLWEYPICYPNRRIKFVSGDNAVKHSPTHSNAFAYLGNNEEKFIEEFKQFGPVVKRVS